MTPRLAERLCKLIPLLASDEDGEVLATVRALQASLQAESLDLHDLAAAIAKTDVVAVPHAPQIAAAPTWADLSHQERRAWMKVVHADPNIGDLERVRLSEADAILRGGMALHAYVRDLHTEAERLARESGSPLMRIAALRVALGDLMRLAGARRDDAAESECGAAIEQLSRLQPPSVMPDTKIIETHTAASRRILQ
jgi:hypothetical protein